MVNISVITISEHLKKHLILLYQPQLIDEYLAAVKGALPCVTLIASCLICGHSYYCIHNCATTKCQFTNDLLTGLD